MSNGDRIEQGLSYFGLLPLLTFPLVSGIPIVGYFIETAAIFFAVWFAYRSRHWLLTAGAAGSIVFALLLFGPHLLIFGLWARVIIPAVLLGRLMNVGLSLGKCFTVAVVFVAAAGLMQYLPERELFQQTLDTAGRWLQGGLMGGAGQNKETMEWMVNMIATMKRLMPTMLVLSGVAQLFVAWVIFLVLLRQLGLFVPNVVGFYYWKMPDTYIYITGVIMLGRLLVGEPLKIIADNLLLFIGFFYAVFGLAVFEYYLKKIRVSLLMRILFYILLLLMQLPGLILAALVGLVDSYFDFRKVKARMIG